MIRYFLVAALVGIAAWLTAAWGLAFTVADLFAFGLGALVGGVFWLTKARRIEYVEVPANGNDQTR